MRWRSRCASCPPSTHSSIMGPSRNRSGGAMSSVSPDPGSKVFFGSGDSDAVDTAAKMTRRYFNAIGQPERTVFISREWAYHGMHPYGTSLGGMEPNRAGYGGDLVADIVIVPHDDAEAVEKAIDHAGAERIAGIFVEPVIGSGWGPTGGGVGISARSRGWCAMPVGSTSRTRSSPGSGGSGTGLPPTSMVWSPT